MNIARIFPTRTELTPCDPDSYTDRPNLFTPVYDEAHISVTFTWDLKKAEWLAEQWKDNAKKTIIGGPAINQCMIHSLSQVCIFVMV